jgi:dipeptidyl aminopeptidase/acylaminoacyl peptidase/CubicO group peptidase (beta-lactamase class C family)
MRFELEDLFRLAIPSQPAISPDGSTVAYVLSTAEKESDENRSALWQVSPGAAPRQLTRGVHDAAPAWSPDGTRLAFLRATDGSPQVWLLPAAGGEPWQLTSLPGGAGEPVWSPDGSRLAFAAMVDTAEEGASQAPVVTDRLGYKLDGAGLLRQRRRHLFVVDTGTGRAQQLTHGDWHAGPPAWSPDGDRLAFSAGTAPDADLTGESMAFVLDLTEDSPAPVPVGDRHGMAGPVTWTPDGSALLVVGRRERTVGHDHLLRVPLAGGEPVSLTGRMDRNVMPGGPGYPGGMPQVTADGRTLLFCVRDRGCTQLYALELADGAAPRLLLGGADRVVSGLSVAGAAGRAAVVLATPTSYGEVVVLDIAGGDSAPAGTVLTAHSPADLDLFAPQERTFTISDGTTVHGWLLRDPEAPAPAPLLLDVHGGPHNAWNPVADVAHPYHQLLVAKGWAVLLLNPRASDGYGEEFFTATAGGWGVADQRDFLEPLDQLVADGVADPARLAVCGYSYGGYMVCWLTGRTDRFAAAIAGGVVADLTSMAGTSDFGHLMARQEIGALPFEDVELTASQSPYARVGAVGTATLILHGAADDRCPPAQAEQWFAALRGRGVPAELVLYPEASHLFILDGRPSHRLDYSRRIVEWVTRGPRTRRPVDRGRWQHRLAELATEHRVPGAVLGIAQAGEVVTVAHGLTNVDTGVAVTPETLFQIGSVSKVWTATAVMRLVEQGVLDLDTPVVRYLPELVTSDPEVTARVTMRQLLNHTSGIDGDVFTDTGRGDDCLERYVASLTDVPQNHPLAATWSYCNTGYSIAGRVIEKVTGKVWDEAMRELLFTPLGLTRTVTLPEQALLHNTAVGHVHEGQEEPRRTPVWGLSRAAGPAGSINASASDLLAFARLHMTGGVTADGERLLSTESVAAMQACEVELPDPYTIADSWGLGWFRLGWDGIRLVGHDGNTIGQSAFLRVLPEHDLAVTLLTNGGHTRDLYESLVREVVRELAGVEMTRPLAPPAQPRDPDVTGYQGTYQRTGVRIDVWRDGDRARLRLTIDMPVAGLDQEPKEFDLVAVRDNRFAIRMPGVRTWIPVTFYELADGTPYIHMGARATRKVGS